MKFLIRLANLSSCIVRFRQIRALHTQIKSFKFNKIQLKIGLLMSNNKMKKKFFLKKVKIDLKTISFNFYWALHPTI